jgi:hypothetical protein
LASAVANGIILGISGTIGDLGIANEETFILRIKDAARQHPGRPESK